MGKSFFSDLTLYFDVAFHSDVTGSTFCKEALFADQVHLCLSHRGRSCHFSLPGRMLLTIILFSLTLVLQGVLCTAKKKRGRGRTVSAQCEMRLKMAAAEPA